jgi:hypothetical protein
VVQLVRRLIVTQQVSPVVGKPQLLRLRVPIEPDGVANAMGEDFEPVAIGLHPQNGRVAFIVALAHVARRSNRHIQHAVRPEADELPAVMPVSGKAIIDHNRLWWISQVVFDVVKAQNAVDGSYIEGAVTKRYPIAACEGNYLIGLIVLVAVYEGVDISGSAGADEQSTARTQHHRAGVGYVTRVDANSKS